MFYENISHPIFSCINFIHFLTSLSIPKTCIFRWLCKIPLEENIPIYFSPKGSSASSLWVMCRHKTTSVTMSPYQLRMKPKKWEHFSGPARVPFGRWWNRLATSKVKALFVSFPSPWGPDGRTTCARAFANPLHFPPVQGLAYSLIQFHIRRFTWQSHVPLVAFVFSDFKKSENFTQSTFSVTFNV